MSPDSREWPVYSVYGLSLATEHVFASGLLQGEGAPDLTFEIVDLAPEAPDWRDAEPLFASTFSLEDGQSYMFLYSHGDLDVLSCRQFADFYLWPDRIVCHLKDRSRHEEVEIYFLGLVLSFWIERMGGLALHAAAVDLDGKAVGFLAVRQGGKTSLAATLARAGHPLLTDDLLAVRRNGVGWLASPAFPQMRMWPDHAVNFVGHRPLEVVSSLADKRRVPVGGDGLGDFCIGDRPLGCLIFPDRLPEDSGVEPRLERLTARDAVIELVRESFLTRLLEAAGLHATRLAALVALAGAVPVFRLTYRSGMEHLPVVRGAVEDHVRAL